MIQLKTKGVSKNLSYKYKATNFSHAYLCDHPSFVSKQAFLYQILLYRE